MNVHAVEVERAAARPLMSGFHALFSIGGFAGAGGMTFLLSVGVTPLAGALCGCALTLVALLLAWPRLLEARGEPTPLVAPRGVVLLLAGLTAVTFLTEGAILDWSALLVIGAGLVGTAKGGLGYMLFSVAMTIGRLTGDRIVGETPVTGGEELVGHDCPKRMQFGPCGGVKPDGQCEMAGKA